MAAAALGFLEVGVKKLAMADSGDQTELARPEAMGWLQLHMPVRLLLLATSALLRLVRGGEMDSSRVSADRLAEDILFVNM